jgi:uncharacterized Zn-finger protein
MLESTSLNQIQDICRVESSVIGCNGIDNGGESAHPLVYLNIGEEGHAICPYCSRKFVLVESSYK